MMCENDVHHRKDKSQLKNNDILCTEKHHHSNHHGMHKTAVHDTITT